MTGFIILCVLAVIVGFVLWGFSNEYEDYSPWKQDFKSVIASLIAMAIFVIMWFVVLIDYNTVAMKIVASVISLWLLMSLAGNGGFCALIYCFVGFVIVGLLHESPYQVYKTDNGLELRHPLTYWLTGRVEAVGVDSVDYRIAARRGNTAYDNGQDISEREIIGLRDSKGRIHLPGICEYKDGFTECYPEFFKADLKNVEILHLCRPDGTSVRLDYLGNDTKADNYHQPEYNNDVEVNTNY